MQWRAFFVDVLVSVAAFAIGVVALAGNDQVASDLRDPDVFAYLLLVVYCAAPVFRRAAPVAAVFVGLLAGVVYAAASYPVALTPIALLSVYTAAAILPQRRARLLLAGAVALGIVGSTLGPGPTDPSVPVLIACAWLLGNYVGTRRAYAAELERKNALLAQAQLELADRAVAEERLRIARELHDVVAHSLSVVALHAGTARMVGDDDPAAAREALTTIETAARSALLEMRRLLGVLRGSNGDEPGALAPAPGLGDLDALVAEVVRSGVTVQVQVDGERPAVPPGVDLSAYRIVQEALTNVIKHGDRAHTTVAVHYSDDAVSIEVDDEGPGGQRSVPATASPGHGLVGMKERVAIYEGDFEAGFRPDGGFHVAARLPFEATR